jgi:hypothetical protein
MEPRVMSPIRQNITNSACVSPNTLAVPSGAVFEAASDLAGEGEAVTATNGASVVHLRFGASADVAAANGALKPTGSGDVLRSLAGA